VRSTAQLNEATTSSHLWVERHDRKLVDVFVLQDEIANATVAAIEPQTPMRRRTLARTANGHRA